MTLCVLAISLPLVSSCLHQVLRCPELGVTIGCHRKTWFFSLPFPVLHDLVTAAKYLVKAGTGSVNNLTLH